MSLCMVGQSIWDVTLGPNSRKLTWSFELKFIHNIAMNMYNTEWVGLKANNTFWIEFDRGQVGYSAS